MLYYWLYSLSSDIHFFNIFKYITFRAGAATFTAFCIGFFLGPRFIRWLKKHQALGQPIRSDGPVTHLTKSGTPTMGGLLILFSLFTSVLLWADLTSKYVWIVLSVMLSFGLIGGSDDYLKLSRGNSKGLPGKLKLLFQSLFSIVTIAAIMHVFNSPLATVLTFPFFKTFLLDLGWFYVLFSVFVIVGSSNAVNLTDGLDGLAIVPIMFAAGCFCVIAYIVGNHVFAHYLQYPFIPGAGELTIFCGALIGAGLSFLWYNAPPAMVFMGDTGSLSIGAGLSTVSLITKHEIVFAFIGGIFVLEAVSVIIQVAYFKLTGRRVFLMAPIHHHFEKKGWAESTVVIRFWIIAALLALIGLATLKIR